MVTQSPVVYITACPFALCDEPQTSESSSQVQRTLLSLHLRTIVRAFSSPSVLTRRLSNPLPERGKLRHCSRMEPERTGVHVDVLRGISSGSHTWHHLCAASSYNKSTFCTYRRGFKIRERYLFISREVYHGFHQLCVLHIDMLCTLCNP